MAPVWRIIVGISLIPAVGTLYQRLTLPESARYIKAQETEQADQDAEAGDEIAKFKAVQRDKELKATTANVAGVGGETKVERTSSGDVDESNTHVADAATAPGELIIRKKAHFKGILLCTFYFDAMILRCTY